MELLAEVPLELADVLPVLLDVEPLDDDALEVDGVPPAVPALLLAGVLPPVPTT